MKNKNYRVSRATLYNTIELLLECGLVRKHQFGDSQAQYEKSYFARSKYSTLTKVHILNEVLFKDEPNNFYDIFPQCRTNEKYKEWHRIDMENMKKCDLFLERDETDRDVTNFFPLLVKTTFTEEPFF